ncbi:MAG: 50S ribosomal protein L7/L12, partial [Ignavibacteriaceae bacterium]|nr:50S ribosomal protein L7/L12 [Ignavibacteriaceae bacterium]
MSEKVTQALELIKGMSLMEAAELKKALEDEFGVTAAAPMMMAGPMAGGTGEAAVVEEQTEFDVILQSAGEKKINVI